MSLRLPAVAKKVGNLVVRHALGQRDGVDGRLRSEGWRAGGGTRRFCWCFCRSFEAEKGSYGFASVFNDFCIDLDDVRGNFLAAHHLSPALSGEFRGIAHADCKQDSLPSGTWEVGFHNETAAVSAASDLDFVYGKTKNAAVNNIAY